MAIEGDTKLLEFYKIAIEGEMQPEDAEKLAKIAIEGKMQPEDAEKLARKIFAYNRETSRNEGNVDSWKDRALVASTSTLILYLSSNMARVVLRFFSEPTAMKTSP